jgi:hypothetical protein
MRHVRASAMHDLPRMRFSLSVLRHCRLLFAAGSAAVPVKPVQSRQPQPQPHVLLHCCCCCCTVYVARSLSPLSLQRPLSCCGPLQPCWPWRMLHVGRATQPAAATDQVR